MKASLHLLVSALLAMGCASGATILLTDVRSSYTESSTSTVSGGSNNGGLTTFSASSIPVLRDNTTTTIPPASGTYGVQVAGITVGIDTNLTLRFNLNVAASTGDGILVRRDTAAPGRGWAVDDNRDGISPGTAKERQYLNAGESITFTVSSITLTGGTGGYDVIFNGFSDALFTVDPSGTATFNPGLIGIMTGTSGTGHVRDLDLSFDISPIPEPSLPLMGGIGIAALLIRRRRR